MEIITTNAMANVSNHILSTAFVKENTSYTTILLASIVASLLFVSSNIKKYVTYQRDKYKHKNSSVKSVSFTELLKTLIDHKFVSFSTIGYLLKKYNGAIKFTVGFYKFVIVSQPSIIQKLYLSPNPGHLSKPAEIEKIFTKSLQGNLGSLRADKWKVHRSILARAFTTNSLKEHVKIFEHYVKKLIFLLDESIQPLPENGQVYSKNQFGQAVASHVYYIMLHIATGKGVLGNYLETERLYFLSKKFKQIMLYRCEQLWRLFDIPWFFNPKRWEFERIRNEMEFLLSKALKIARKEISFDSDDEEEMAGKSLVYLMIKAGFSDEQIFKELFMFLLVSNEGVPSTLKTLLFHLALDPNLQEKCRMEVFQMFEKLNSNGSSEISITLLNELQFLEQCIKETIRMYPTLLLTARILESPLILDDHTTIEPGTQVIISAYHLHRDCKYYPEPGKFDPDRFSPDNERKREKCEYMGFSKGPRDCIGNKSAMLELKVLASYILYNFEPYTNNTLEKFVAEIGPTPWPVPDPKVELRRRN